MSPSADAPPAPLPDSFERARQLFLGGLEQLAQGRLAEAEKSFLDSLALLPGRASTLINLAAVRVRLGRPQDAIEAADEVIRQEPGNGDAWFQRAEALAQAGRPQEALQAFSQAAQHNRAAMPWYRHGQVLQDLQRDDEALQSYDKALAADRSFAPAWTNKGNILRERSRLAEAAQAFREAVAHGGADALHDYYLASVTPGADTSAPVAPAQYVAGLFDAYAEEFDKHVVGVLGYHAPELLADGIFRVAPGRWFRSVLDLGCGTGLVGLTLKSCSDERLGVDLSGQMLRKAQATNCYRRLAQQDIACFLQGTETRHDLVVAADVFIYIGELEPVFAGVARVIEPGGLFCFSLEELPAQEAAADFRLQPSLRYAHSERYARALAAAHGLQVLAVQRAPLRQDQRKPIEGLFVYLSRPAR